MCKWTSDAMAVGAPYLQIQCNIQSNYGRLKTPRAVNKVSFQCHHLHDLIIVLDTLCGDMHGAQFLGKSESLLYLPISIFNSF